MVAKFGCKAETELWSRFEEFLWLKLGAITVSSFSCNLSRDLLDDSIQERLVRQVIGLFTE